jgi:hypothetical protein
MGARTNFSFQDGSGHAINLYSHWGGGTAYKDLALALEKAEPRWQDISYGIRIAISQIIGDYWNQETGYGLSVDTLGEEEYDTLVVDFPNQVVSDGKLTWNFEAFIKEFTFNFEKYLTKGN